MRKRSARGRLVLSTDWLKIPASMDRAGGIRESIRKTRANSRPTLVTRDALRVLTGVSDAELTLWEQEELIAPAAGSTVNHDAEVLYETSALRRVRLIRTLAEELEVNVPGIGVILHLLDQISR
jgi:hypothetical protein